MLERLPSANVDHRLHRLLEILTNHVVTSDEMQLAKLVLVRWVHGGLPLIRYVQVYISVRLHLQNVDVGDPVEGDLELDQIFVLMQLARLGVIVVLDGD